MAMMLEVSMFLVTVLSLSVTVCSLCLMAGQCCPNRSQPSDLLQSSQSASQSVLRGGPGRTCRPHTHHVIWDPPCPVTRGTPCLPPGAGVSPSSVSSTRRRSPAPGEAAGPRRSPCWAPSGAWGTRTAPPSGGGESRELQIFLTIRFDNDTIYPYLSLSQSVITRILAKITLSELVISWALHALS